MSFNLSTRINNLAKIVSTIQDTSLTNPMVEHLDMANYNINSCGAISSVSGQPLTISTDSTEGLKIDSTTAITGNLTVSGTINSGGIGVQTITAGEGIMLTGTAANVVINVLSSQWVTSGEINNLTDYSMTIAPNNFTTYAYSSQSQFYNSLTDKLSVSGTMSANSNCSIGISSNPPNLIPGWNTQGLGLECCGFINFGYVIDDAGADGSPTIFLINNGVTNNVDTFYNLVYPINYEIEFINSKANLYINNVLKRIDDFVPDLTYYYNVVGGNGGDLSKLEFIQPTVPTLAQVLASGNTAGELNITGVGILAVDTLTANSGTVHLATSINYMLNGVYNSAFVQLMNGADFLQMTTETNNAKQALKLTDSANNTGIIYDTYFNPLPAAPATEGIAAVLAAGNNANKATLINISSFLTDYISSNAGALNIGTSCDFNKNSIYDVTYISLSGATGAAGPIGTIALSTDIIADKQILKLTDYAGNTGIVYDTYFNPLPAAPATPGIAAVLAAGNNANKTSITNLDLVLTDYISSNSGALKLNTSFDFGMNAIYNMGFAQLMNGANSLSVSSGTNGTNQALKLSDGSTPVNNGFVYDTFFNPIPQSIYKQYFGALQTTIAPVGLVDNIFSIAITANNGVNTAELSFNSCRFSFTSNAQFPAGLKASVFLSDTNASAFSPTSNNYNYIQWDVSKASIFTSTVPIILFFNGANIKTVFLNINLSAPSTQPYTLVFSASAMLSGYASVVNTAVPSYHNL